MVVSTIAGVTNLAIKGAEQQIATGSFPESILSQIESKFLVPYGHIPAAKDRIKAGMKELEERISVYDYNEMTSLEKMKDLSEEEKPFVQYIKDSHLARISAFGDG